MKLKKTALSTAVLVTLGLGGMAVGPVASAAVIANGTYLATINPTPLTASATPGSYLIIPGTDGAWNSSFSFSKLPKRTSQKMFDNDNSLTLPSGTYGSSKSGYGAGSWDMTMTNGTFTASNFQVDAILTTAGGTFVEYGTIAGGAIDQTSGAMTLDPTGRLGAVGAGVYNAAWNIPDVVAGTAGTTYAPLVTGTSTNADGSVTGHGIVPIAGTNDYNVILVSASAVGAAWGSFDSTPYVEAWNVHIAPVPIPAAAWLFGSGLIGLVGIARRKKSS